MNRTRCGCVLKVPQGFFRGFLSWELFFFYRISNDLPASLGINSMFVVHKMEIVLWNMLITVKILLKSDKITIYAFVKTIF